MEGKRLEKLDPNAGTILIVYFLELILCSAKLMGQTKVIGISLSNDFFSWL
jgi:hypothetical protein